MLAVKEIKFSTEALKKVDEIIARYPESRQKSALLPLLHLAQAEFGWCSTEVMDYVASLLNINPIEVYEVASFYTMYHLKPSGKYVLEVCRTGPCCLVGAEKIINILENKLGVKEGEVTPDGLFSFKGVECLAACGYGPVLQIGPEYTFYENLTEESVDELLTQLRNKN
ncbi:NAD(P)H-dependent oxidoreductase subunit E [Solitalea longa]|uniref:NAD(P)H-dependent oxidoreductase subunit E n=1 Tax=Solitalea longa TaxID=2079460 RepID=A0A2S5A451_9SPHI|nr:NAD(P)H-dependent oxidoreductase subunit E [Solitalea longa]POY37079.1 NAD(P)H-dependent oxidoreductase subunit E [Solitalea longa]